MKVRCSYSRMVPIADLKPYPNNPNKHSKDQIQRLAEILSYQGIRRPVRVSNLSERITAGHGQVAACKLNGWDKVPVDFQDYDDEDQEFADVVADNSLHEWTGLGTDLSMVNEKLGELGPDLDLDMLGIENFELEPADKGGGGGGLTDEDDVPESGETRVKPGDLWVLGDHRLFCGDCTKDLPKLMDGELTTLLFTDPPYNMASKEKLIASTVSQSMRKLKASEWDKNFNILPFLESVEASLSENCSIYIFTSWHLAGDIWNYYATRSTTSGYCVWHKPNPMPSLMKRHWTWGTELICYATRGKHTFNFPNEGHAENLWSINKNQRNELHPTQKPVAVPEHAILHSSSPGDLVLDPFLGSGSTLMACQKTDRRCFGMEIDPKYCGVAIRRWEDYTGKQAEKLPTQ